MMRVSSDQINSRGIASSTSAARSVTGAFCFTLLQRFIENRHNIGAIFITAVFFSMSGCAMVGPDFKTPEAAVEDGDQ